MYERKSNDEIREQKLGERLLGVHKQNFWYWIEEDLRGICCNNK
jgi:hypothetical protein